MRVLAADPGYERLGVAILEKNSSTEQLLFSNCIQTSKDKSLHDRLLEIGDAWTLLIEQHSPECVALERLFFNVNQKTALAVAETRGVLTYLSRKHDLPIFEYSPQEIKIATTGYGKSSKKQVADMVEKLVTIDKKPKFDDEYDAIAVGITCLAHEKI